MERLHTAIKLTIWTCIVIVTMLLVDWIGREVILNLPW
jgi:hypothetical protein